MEKMGGGGADLELIVWINYIAKELSHLWKLQSLKGGHLCQYPHIQTRRILQKTKSGASKDSGQGRVFESPRKQDWVLPDWLTREFIALPKARRPCSSCSSRVRICCGIVTAMCFPFQVFIALSCLLWSNRYLPCETQLDLMERLVHQPEILDLNLDETLEVRW